MIDRRQLRELHNEDLPLHILEQDYVQALFLTELYSETETLVFKGGTYLKHAHGLDRFSEDLDFTAVKSAQLIPELRSAASALVDYGVTATLDNVSQSQNAITARLQYEGPLYDGTDRSRGRIEIDVSKRGDIYNPTEWVRLFFPYPETRAVVVRGMELAEILAEKLRALSTRSQGRDLYDIWFLLAQGATIDPSLFQRKMEVVGEEAQVAFTIDADEWERDLPILLNHPPCYTTVKDNVLTALQDKNVAVIDHTS